ncbi:hypothetical protein M440DRAFT_1066445 [Trichoderma longibrachiatum ATCC 18648]|uniref:Secreted protein n=1 Tax=Trichoderma longibrachiatum ATCC 18648 TaxID=983965 RepID=A0A2T4BWD0_TRILO|nr:hypothetical protein M440DRAFT_1066445 [Trichoderma longibrachiatum ATCC 18648]
MSSQPKCINASINRTSALFLVVRLLLVLTTASSAGNPSTLSKLSKPFSKLHPQNHLCERYLVAFFLNPIEPTQSARLRTPNAQSKG